MTLHYEFPSIHYWHTVAKYFEGNDNFVIVDKGDYFVVNYVLMGEETFPVVEGEDYHRASVLREGRGLIFCSKTGELLSRPFHKFFNVGERADTAVLDLSKKHWILSKLDGSMVRPFMLNGNIRWATKSGITDVSMQAEEFVAKNPHYHDFAEQWLKMEYTPIFEWCSRKQRIVIDYPEDQLVLLAVRDNFTGQYLHDALNDAQNIWGIPTIQAIDLSGMNQEQIVQTVRVMEDSEGVVIRFEDGHMVKIKADSYVRMHKAKSYLENERDVIRLILEEQIDDVLPLLTEEDKNRVKKLQDQILHDILIFQTAIAAVRSSIKTLELSRKDFALKSESMDPLLRAAVFKFFNDLGESMEYINYTKDLILKHLGSKQSYEKIKRSVLKTVDYRYGEKE